MELIRGCLNLAPRHRGCVATIGNFDGVHRGHQAVLAQVAEKATKRGLPAVVITFEPQPQEYFAPAATPPRLTRFREKMLALDGLPVDRVLCLRFGPALAELSADAFIRRILVDGLDLRYLVVGDDFRFGRGRTGDFQLLSEAGREHGFSVAHTESFLLDGVRVSSTRIREALSCGNLSLAERLLGRPFRISGRVAHGDKRGRTIGFPTANILLKRKVSPVQGVYAVHFHGVADEPATGVANVGTRPTVDGGTRVLLEVHLFDFARDIYGAHVQVDFLAKLRDEQRFASLDALKAQIWADANQARDFFSKQGSGTVPLG